jgi:phosphoglycolate phosphatase
MLLRRSFESDDVPRSAHDAFEARYDEICCEKSTILADVEATLKTLHGFGVVMAVCTNKRTSLSKKILTFLELAPYFSAIVGPDLAGASKPDAKHVLHALETTRCAVVDALFIGDMPIDVQAARNSGMDVAVIATGSSSAEELIAARPDFVLEKFSELVNLVGRQDRKVEIRDSTDVSRQP